MQKEKQLKSCCKNNLSSREVVARDLPHPMPLFNEKKQPCFTRDVEDPRTLRAAKPSGMTTLSYNGTKAFTLIELLVVVLIIGILAAVALPQYQKAVWKSRFTQAKIAAKSIADAEEVYYMANGVYTTDFEQLAVSLPSSWVDETNHIVGFSWGACTIANNANRSVVYCVLKKNGSDYLAYYIDFLNSAIEPGQIYCVAWGTASKPIASDINYQICKSDTNDPYPGSMSDKAYGWEYESR